MGNGLMVHHACNPVGTERHFKHFNAMRLAPPTLSSYTIPNFSDGRCPAPGWQLLPVRKGFPFLLLSENVIIDDDRLYSLKLITDLGGKGERDDVWVADVDDRDPWQVFPKCRVPLRSSCKVRQDDEGRNAFSVTWQRMPSWANFREKRTIVRPSQTALARRRDNIGICLVLGD